MILIPWDQKYSVGIKSIDEHHQRLFQLLNEFYQELNTNSVHATLLRMVKDLQDYAAYHFTAEERFMEDHGYANLAAHKKAHEEFVEKVKDYRARFESGKLLVSVEVTNFIRDWLTNHIMRMDQAYSGFLKAKGVT